jgi:hypothetical protein
VVGAFAAGRIIGLTTVRTGRRQVRPDISSALYEVTEVELWRAPATTKPVSRNVRFPLIRESKNEKTRVI